MSRLIFGGDEAPHLAKKCAPKRFVSFRFCLSSYLYYLFVFHINYFCIEIAMADKSSMAKPAVNLNVIKRKFQQDKAIDISTDAASILSLCTPKPKKVKKKIQQQKAGAGKEKAKDAKKSLTPKQRIDRLKKKISSKRTNQNDVAVPVEVTNEPVIDSTEAPIRPLIAPGVESYDQYFVDDSGRLVLDDTTDMATNGAIFNSTPQKSSQHSGEIQLESTIESVNRQGTSESTDIRYLLMTLNGKFDDLNGQIGGLKRQVARLEAKSTMCRNPNEAFALHQNDDTFVDFDSALAAEGLPAKTIEFVYAFEKRLQITAFNTSSYRQKLVS